MSLIMLMMFSICSASSMSSGRWSLISAYVRKPRSLPSTMRFLRRVRRASASLGRASSFSFSTSLTFGSFAMATYSFDLCEARKKPRIIPKNDTLSVSFDRLFQLRCPPQQGSCFRGKLPRGGNSLSRPRHTHLHRFGKQVLNAAPHLDPQLLRTQALQ